jgi:hemerythrin-like domain-containing protein
VKRSEALQSLSRDHDQALVQAQRLRNAADAEQVLTGFLDFWRSECELHFPVEEEVLLPRWAMLGRVDQNAASRLCREHLAIRTSVLEAQKEPSIEGLRELGEQLAAHVRFEERELFPLLEADLDEERLQVLASAVSAAEQNR